ncbi:MAG: DNA-binding domain-containing protein [Steroidobacteraceae bacterium]
MSPSLAEIQDEFVAALRDPGRPAPPDVLGPDRRPDARRFAVYRNNVVHGLVNALEARFPVTSRLVGTQFFRAMARAFVGFQLPRTPLLMNYGDEFPRFIADFAPAREVPYLADLARLERAWSQSFHAAEAIPLTVETLALRSSLDLAQCRLRLHPSLRLVRSPHPIATIWSSHQSAGEVTPPAAWEAEDVLVVRPHAEVRLHLLPHSGCEFVLALAAGNPVQDAAEAALAHDAEFDVGHHLVGLAGLGAIVSLEPAAEPAKLREKTS